MIKLFSAASYWPKLHDHKNVHIDWFRWNGKLPIKDIAKLIQGMEPVDSWEKQETIHYLNDLFTCDEIKILKGFLGNNIEITEEICLPISYQQIKGRYWRDEYISPGRDEGMHLLKELMPAVAQQLPFTVMGEYNLLDSETKRIEECMDDLMSWIHNNFHPLFMSELKALCQKYGHDNRWDKILGEFREKMFRMQT